MHIKYIQIQAAIAVQDFPLETTLRLPHKPADQALG